MTKNALQRAIESVGNARLFAAKLNITEQSVGKWKINTTGLYLQLEFSKFSMQLV